ncbi:MAG: glycoside hydrolase family 13 protein [Saprospiraceae bacterium]
MNFKNIVFFITTLLFVTSIQSQVIDTSIYDNDPTQRRPKGVTIPEYKNYKSNGSLVDSSRIEPAFWWTGMKNKTLELMIYDTYITDHSVNIKYKGVKVKKIYKVRNPNYLFVSLEISPKAKPGKFNIMLTNGLNTRNYEYELKARNTDPKKAQGINSADFVYMIMPDRFANGEPKNDSYEDMLQVGINRQKMFFRHGGDIQGVINQLDYLKNMGVTSVWLNPVQENDQLYESYHGYAVTDWYKIDKRFGSNELYKKFVEECHSRNMKVVMDIVLNHIGLNHWWMHDLPMEDWIHQFHTFTRTNYRDPIWYDPHIAPSDKKTMTDGWFDYLMPDLNQQNPRLATQLIQTFIWWIEYAGLDAYRIDTYPYNDDIFMATLNKSIRDEYPNFFLFGECWVQGVHAQSYYYGGSIANQKFDSFMNGGADFQMNFAIQDALTKPAGWSEGIGRLYLTLAADFMYPDSYTNVLFLDNHDMSRIFSVVGEDVNKMKTAATLLLTMRGIPQIYYGTEILMKNFSNPDGLVREDFPGGWEGDAMNKFTPAGRTDKENEFFNFLSKLANYRKNTPALHQGKLIQYIPQDGVYFYFRQDASKTVMVAMNTNNKTATIPITRFQEMTKNGKMQIKDVLTDKMYNLLKLEIEPNSSIVLEW